MIVEGFRPRYPCPTVTLPVRPEGQDCSHGSRVSKRDDRFGVSAYVTVPVVPHDQSRRCNGLPISIVKRNGGHADAPFRATDRSQPSTERDAPSPPPRERIHDLDPRRFEVLSIASDHHQSVRKRGRGDQAVLDWHWSLAGAESCKKLRPAESDLCIQRYAMDPAHDLVEPEFNGISPRPGPSRRMPNQISPSTTGFTAMSCSCARSHPTTLGLGFGFVVSERTFVSTRYLIVRLLESRTIEVRRRLGWNRDEPTLLGAGQQQVYQPRFVGTPVRARR